MGQLGLESVFPREDNRVFIFGRSFKLSNLGGVFSLGLLDRFQANFETGFDSVDIGLNPDKGRSVTVGAEEFFDLFAILLGVELAFDDEILASLSD